MLCYLCLTQGSHKQLKRLELQIAKDNQGNIKLVMLNKHPSRTGTQTTVETPHMTETISDFEKYNELMSSFD
jgi:hypothetical protein